MTKRHRINPPLHQKIAEQEEVGCGGGGRKKASSGLPVKGVKKRSARHEDARECKESHVSEADATDRVKGSASLRGRQEKDHQIEKLNTLALGGGPTQRPSGSQTSYSGKDSRA